MKYWFRPLRFWKYFACYYPASFAGMIATFLLGALLVSLFFFFESRSHSATDTLIALAPWMITILALFDLLCFRFGEYPSWWKRYQKHKK